MYTCSRSEHTWRMAIRHTCITDVHRCQSSLHSISRMLLLTNTYTHTTHTNIHTYTQTRMSFTYIQTHMWMQISVQLHVGSCMLPTTHTKRHTHTHMAHTHDIHTCMWIQIAVQLPWDLACFRLLVFCFEKIFDLPMYWTVDSICDVLHQEADFRYCMHARTLTYADLGGPLRIPWYGGALSSATCHIVDRTHQLGTGVHSLIYNYALATP